MSTIYFEKSFKKSHDTVHDWAVALPSPTRESTMSLTGFDPSVLQPSCACCDGKVGIWNGLRAPCMPLNGCCHVGVCCQHTTCYTGCQPAASAAICLAGCVGKLPCYANSCLCMHGGCGKITLMFRPLTSWYCPQDCTKCSSVRSVAPSLNATKRAKSVVFRRPPSNLSSA